MWWLLCIQQQWCGDEENLFSIQSLVPTERKMHQPELGEAASNDVSSSCRSGDHWMYAKEYPREFPWKMFSTTKPGDLESLGGVERIESRTLLCRLIAHRIWIVFLSLYKTYGKERINKEDSVVQPMTTPKSNLVMQLVCLCCGLFLSMVEPSVRPELSDQPIPFPCGGAMGVPVSSLSDVVVNLLKYMTSDRESR